jgi:hypothetical protein
MSRSMVKLIHADDFFPEQDVKNLVAAVQGMQFVPCGYGYELPNFNLIFPDIEIILNKVLGERVIVDVNRSGVIRKPYNNAIHFENFESSEEWCFIIALEKTTINLWHHIDDIKKGDISQANSKSVFEGHEFDYENFFEWKIHTNIVLEPNQGIFIRPWVFHSLESGLVQYYRLLPDNKFRILVMGHPGSKKDAVVEKLAKRFESCNVIDSMRERENLRDLDFTEPGHMRHVYRILNQARQSQSQVTIINMTCPIPKMREILNPDFLVYVNDKTESEYEVFNELFEAPQVYDIECADDSDETIEGVLKRVRTKRK